MSLRQTNKNRTARAILVAATEVLSERGVDAAPVDVIARRADVSVGSIYTHYGSKEGLRNAVINEAAELAEHALLAPQVAFVVGSALERLSAHGRAYARFALEQPREFRLLAHVLLGGHGPERLSGAPHAAAVLDRIAERLAAHIDAGVRAREIGPTDPELAAMFLIGSWTGVLSMTARGQASVSDAARMAATLEVAAVALASGARSEHFACPSAERQERRA